MSFRATVESMSKIMDDMGITELDLERQFLFGVYRKHIHLSKGTTVTMPSFPVDKTVKNSTTGTNSTAHEYTNALKSPMVGQIQLPGHLLPKFLLQHRLRLP